jgi:L-2,4-diaminobutyric acid acetyltransferase
MDLIELREPTAADGADVSRLVANCPPLDRNSTYCNLLQCSHFSNTSVAAFENGRLIGFISGYLIPSRPDTLFIWQVAVSETARGLGLASAMLQHLIDRPQNLNLSHLETSITESNDASWMLFKCFARKHNAPFEQEIMFDQDKHFQGQHDTEFLLRIGPIERTATSIQFPSQTTTEAEL